MRAGRQRGEPVTDLTKPERQHREEDRREEDRVRPQLRRAVRRVEERTEENAQLHVNGRLCADELGPLPDVRRTDPRVCVEPTDLGAEDSVQLVHKESRRLRVRRFGSQRNHEREQVLFASLEVYHAGSREDAPY